jgi:hypothetical protein
LHRKGGRPAGPSPETVQKILSAILLCSCGKNRNPTHGLSSKDFINIMTGVPDPCSCVGPKSWKGLRKITKLPRDTLRKALKYLIEIDPAEKDQAKKNKTKKAILTRTVLRRHGRHGEHIFYSFNPNHRDFRIVFGSRFLAENEATAEKWRKQIDSFQKFKNTRIYSPIFKKYKWLDKLVPYEAEFLARQIYVHGGLDEAAEKIFKAQRKHWQTLRLRNQTTQRGIRA